MSARSAVVTAAGRALASAPVASMADRRHRDGVRILALHGVPDAAAFDALVGDLVAHHRPVSGADVLAARSGGPALPVGAVWVTFDDGDPSVVTTGLAVLRRHGVPATMYVCPGLVEADAPPWWDVVLAAGDAGHGAEVDGRELVGPDLVQALKVVPDARRRAVVAALADASPAPVPGAALSEAQLGDWVDAGMEVGNHTWDHPCLDRCTGDEQVAQLRRADRWLRERWGDAVRTAAYPNGDHTETAEAALAHLGYELGLLFDHRVARLDQPALRTSRLRLDADAPVTRARAVVGGAHADVFHATRRTAALGRRTVGALRRSR